MNVYAINGSPRKKWNTALLLENALEGAASRGAATELIHLYDIDFKGCTSCFGCKLKNGRSYGRCVMKDGLTPVLEKLAQADAIIFGSPIYFGTVTGEMRSFTERLLFQYFTYTRPSQSLFGRNIPTAFVYTMNVPEEMAKEMQYPLHFGMNENYTAHIFGQCETFCCYETLQVDDYDRIVFSYFDPEQRKERRRSVFPDDCRKAAELGARLVDKAGSANSDAAGPETGKISG